MLISMDASFLK